jgi:hypothetical protein
MLRGGAGRLTSHTSKQKVTVARNPGQAPAGVAHPLPAPSHAPSPAQPKSTTTWGMPHKVHRAWATVRQKHSGPWANVGGEAKRFHFLSFSFIDEDGRLPAPTSGLSPLAPPSPGAKPCAPFPQASTSSATMAVVRKRAPELPCWGEESSSSSNLCKPRQAIPHNMTTHTHTLTNTHHKGTAHHRAIPPSKSRQ